MAEAPFLHAYIVGIWPMDESATIKNAASHKNWGIVILIFSS